MSIYIVPDQNESVFDRMKRKTEEKGQKLRGWFDRIKETILILAPASIGGVTTVVEVVTKRSNLRKEEGVKILYCYDRSLGRYWPLRRELSNAELLEINKRKKNGEQLTDILDELDVLK